MRKSSHAEWHVFLRESEIDGRDERRSICVKALATGRCYAQDEMSTKTDDDMVTGDGDAAGR